MWEKNIFFAKIIGYNNVNTQDCFQEILGLPYLLCIFFTNNVINNNFNNMFMYKFFNRIDFCFQKWTRFLSIVVLWYSYFNS